MRREIAARVRLRAGAVHDALSPGEAQARPRRHGAALHHLLLGAVDLPDVDALDVNTFG